MKFPAFEPIQLKNETATFDAVDLALNKIEPDPNQPRKNFSEATLEELSLSIKHHGVIQPILVREIGQGKKFQIIAGERRWRAAKLAGLQSIPAIIKSSDKASRMAVALIENIQRESLNPLEEAEAIQRLIEECYMTHHQVAESIGRSRATVTNLLRLLTLSDEVKNFIHQGLLEMGHARALLTLSNEQQIELAQLIIKQSLSVRETEKQVKRLHEPLQWAENALSLELKNQSKIWGQALSKKIASKVNVQLNADGKGRVVIGFDSVEEAEWLVEHLNVGDSVG